MYYGTSGDVRELLGNPAELEVNASIIDQGRKKATALVDSYLESVYPSVIPFTEVASIPEIINSITNDLAVYYIRRSLHPGPLPLTKEVKVEFWEEPKKILESIKKREIDIPELTSSLTLQVGANREEFTPIFDVDEIENSEVDPDLENNIEDKKD